MFAVRGMARGTRGPKKRWVETNFSSLPKKKNTAETEEQQRRRMKRKIYEKVGADPCDPWHTNDCKLWCLEHTMWNTLARVLFKMLFNVCNNFLSPASSSFAPFGCEQHVFYVYNFSSHHSSAALRFSMERKNFHYAWASDGWGSKKTTICLKERSLRLHVFMELSHADTSGAVYCCSQGQTRLEARERHKQNANSGSMRGNGTDDIESNRRKSSSPTSTLDWLTGVIYCSRNTQVTGAEKIISFVFFLR